MKRHEAELQALQAVGYLKRLAASELAGRIEACEAEAEEYDDEDDDPRNYADPYVPEHLVRFWRTEGREDGVLDKDSSPEELLRMLADVVHPDARPRAFEERGTCRPTRETRYRDRVVRRVALTIDGREAVFAADTAQDLAALGNRLLRLRGRWFLSLDSDPRFETGGLYLLASLEQWEALVRLEMVRADDELVAETDAEPFPP